MTKISLVGSSGNLKPVKEDTTALSTRLIDTAPKSLIKLKADIG